MIATRADLKQYILECLGSPLIDINVTENQMDNMIDDAILYFQEYYWDGLKKGYYTHTVSAQEVTSGVLTIPDYIYSVSYIVPIGLYGMNNLRVADPLSPAYQLLYDALKPGAVGQGNLVFFEQVTQHMSMIQNLLVAQTRFSFNRLEGGVIIHDKTNLKENEILLMEVHATLDLTGPSKFWNERMFKQYCTAKTQKQWGINLSKYQGIQLPGGVTVDGDSMIAKANEEIQKIEDWITTALNPVHIYVG